MQLMQRFHYAIDWNLMQPCSNRAGAACAADSSSSSDKLQRDLKTVNNFTLCPAGGIWVKLEPRERPEGVKLL